MLKCLGLGLAIDSVSPCAFVAWWRTMAGPGKHGDPLLDLLEPEPEPDKRYAAITEYCQGLRLGYGRAPSRSRSRSPRRAGSSVSDGTLRRNMMRQVTEGAIHQLAILRNDCDPEIVRQLETDPSTPPSCDLVDPIEVEEFFDAAYRHCVQTIASLARDKFYVGICCSPLGRWHNPGYGHVHEWHQMNLLVVTTGGAAAKLERALIQEFKGYPTCRNSKKGA